MESTLAVGGNAPGWQHWRITNEKGTGTMADHIRVTLNTAQFNRRLTQLVQRSSQATDEVVLQVASDVLSDTIENWPVDSGASRAAWWGPRRLAEAAYQIGNPFVYAGIIEYGGYPGEGPKTQRFAGEALPGGQNINEGIYPTQVPQAPLRRALAANYQKMTRAIGARLKQTWVK